MADKELVRLAVQSHKGHVEKYSTTQAQDVIHKSILELNNGKNYLDLRDVRDGKCVGLFSFIEETLSQTVVDDLQSHPYIANLVDFRNVAEGDQNMFVIEDNDLFVISKAADGTQGIRRQRLGGRSEVAIPTQLRVVKIYEELNRVLAGRVDFDYFVKRVSESYAHNILVDVNALWANVSASQIGGTNYYPVAGTYNEATLLKLIAHVEAAAGGKQATIVGTKIGLQKLAMSIVADSAKEDLYNLGYYGKFFSTPVVAIPQSYKFNTQTFMYPDDTFTIIAGDERPIKFVYEGSPIVLMGQPTDNQDLTQEYLYADKYGMGIVMSNGGNSGIGKYKITD